MSTNYDFDNDLAHALGEGEIRTWRGMNWNVRFLDIEDLIAFKKEFGNGGFSLDTSNLEQVRFFFYLALRKSDPRLTVADIEAEKWKLTEKQVGRLLSLKALSEPDTVEFLNYLLVGSGLKQTEDEKAKAEKAEAEAKKK